MEYDELESLWTKYNSKLDNLERLNKKLITETLIRKPQKKLNWFTYRYLYGLITAPIIIIIALHESFRIENVNLLFILGGILILAVLIYGGYIQYQCYRSLKSIDLQNDSIVNAAQKVNDFKKIVTNNQRSYLITMPVMCAGVLLLCWKGFNFNTNTIAFMIGLLVVIFLYTQWQVKKENNRIERLKRDILDLEEYKE